MAEYKLGVAAGILAGLVVAALLIRWVRVRGHKKRCEFDERQEQRPEQRREGRVLFFGMRFVVRGFGSHENTPGKWPPLCGRSRKER